LLKSALVQADEITGDLTVHRLVQSTVLENLSSISKVIRFEDAVLMVHDKFPPMISKTFHYRAESAWKICEKFLPHALSLEHNYRMLKMKLGDGGVLAFRKLLGDVIMFVCTFYSSQVPFTNLI
jgi:hypothetical protein